jgi:hypothetical protein
MATGHARVSVVEELSSTAFGKFAVTALLRRGCPQLPDLPDHPLPSYTHTHTQSDHKVSVHLMITIEKVTSNVQSVLRKSPNIQLSLLGSRPGQGDTRLTLTPSVIPNSNYVIMVSV